MNYIDKKQNSVTNRRRDLNRYTNCYLSFMMYRVRYTPIKPMSFI